MKSVPALLLCFLPIILGTTLRYILVSYLQWICRINIWPYLFNANTNLFKYKYKSNIPIWVKNFEGLVVEKAGIFFGPLEYIMAIWYISWLFGNLVAICFFPPFWYIVSRKIWQPYLG
jgi:hypothetical protein